MSQEQERSAEAPSLPSLAEILQSQGELLEQIAEDQSAPLRLKELPHVKAGVKLPWTDLESDEVARLVSWPTRHTWAGKPSVQFGSGEFGDIKFFVKTVEKSRISDDQKEFSGLNNFWALLHTRPYGFDGELPTKGTEVAYAQKPALIRAWTAFPEFMDALQRDLGEIGEMYQLEDTFTEQIEAEELHLLRGSRLAYGLLTRLVCKGDREIEAKLQDSMFPEPVDVMPQRHYTAITDPSKELWGWS